MSIRESIVGLESGRHTGVGVYSEPGTTKPAV